MRKTGRFPISKLLFPLLIAGLCFNAAADDAPVPPAGEKPATTVAEPSNPGDWSNHFQLTTVTQTHFGFHSPYQGANSLTPRYEIPSSVTATLFEGHKLWKDAYFFVNPEESIGSGLSQTHGIAAFPSGEIYRVDDPSPKINLSRLFYQQDIGLGGGTEQVEDAQNVFPAKKDIRRLTFVAGKFSLNDYFDDNTYAHDPRTQFLNWALMDDPAWDYAADTRGYTWGFYCELHLEEWSLRAATVEEPAIANQLDLDTNIGRAHGDNFEFEHRHQINGHPGKASLLGYMNHAFMGDYRQSIQLGIATGSTPDITLTRAYRTKYGVGLNLEQELTPDLGVFSRIGWNDGATETWAFTEVDRAFSIGASLKGGAWHRENDTVGLAFIIDGLSKDHADYLSAGGLGFIVGDGALNYAPEQVIEAYYSYKPIRFLSFTGDFQFVNHPAYNADRGPVPIYALRMHFEI
ncbi:MAG: carbohydrate porin [Oligoflexia bacterium]|nr:carbohydrate porin [Oligoflexia bacterium]